MWLYIIKRVLLILPTLLVVTLLVFFLGQFAPGDPVLMILHNEEITKQTAQDFTQSEQAYRQVAEKLGTQLPLFYFSLVPQFIPDTLHHIIQKSERQAAKSLAFQTGNWDVVEFFRQAQASVKTAFAQSSDSLTQAVTPFVFRQMAFISQSGEIPVILSYVDSIQTRSLYFDKTSTPIIAIANLQKATQKIKNTQANFLDFFPKIVWHGSQNQYHRWLAKIFKGDWGISIRDNRPVLTKIKEAFQWTLMLNILSILLTVILSIPLGVYAAAHAGKWIDKFIQSTTFLLQAMPAFLVATIAIMFFSTDEYSVYLDWFPAVGLGDEIFPEDTFLIKFIKALPHLILPILCLTYGGVAYLIQQMRNSMSIVLQQDYIKFAKSKGLPQSQIIHRHALRNAIFPIIIIIAGAFGDLLAGSLTVEVIFNIPGMGRLLVESVGTRDWNVVLAILIIGTLLTLLFNLFADLILKKIDPRVKFQ